MASAVATIVPPPLSAGVRQITIDAGGVALSALLSEPPVTKPRATVVALHGGGMTSAYFDGQAHPDVSLLTLGARLGYTVLAIDRPGYGLSAAQLPDGAPLAEQAELVQAALQSFSSSYPVGHGMFLLAHSYGGKLALATTARAPVPGLFGIDISGCGHQYARQPDLTSAPRRAAKLNWGQLSFYPPGTFAASAPIAGRMPVREYQELGLWPERFPGIAARVTVPVRFTFAEHEPWWRTDGEAIADMTAQLASPYTIVEQHRRAGHNISLGWSARPYHLRALAFLEECLGLAATPERTDDADDQ
jgi:pimeloyl-ACP methyl ester carboxylesterase